VTDSYTSTFAVTVTLFGAEGRSAAFLIINGIHRLSRLDPRLVRRGHEMERG